MTDDHLDGFADFDVISVRNGTAAETKQSVATEVPCTIVVNDNEVATIMCTPTHFKEFAVGYLYTSGMINSAREVKGFCCDEKRWRLDVTTTKDIDFALLGKRVYTSGCGRGVMYSNVIMLSSRHPLETQFHVTKECVSHCVKWLLSCSSLYKETRGVHTAALSIDGELPAFYRDDIGRHNAVDKVIGRSLMDGADFSRSILISTGRISSEILHKVKRTGIPFVLSRGAPTHQTVLMAREMGVTVIGFARGGSFIVYANTDRVTLE
jgi:FdhD protein